MIAVQRLGADDWERGREIRMRALADAPDAFGSTLAEEEALGVADWMRRVRRRDAATFVAVADGGGDVGLAVGAGYDDQAGLFAMWVAPGNRGEGVGGALVDAVIEWATGEGFEKLFLDVGDENREAIALYASRGFLPTGITGTLPPPREQVLEHQRVLLLRSAD